MSDIKVSICIPSYNHGKFIAEAINSALGQDFDSFEVLVSDDWSTDDTHEILSGYKDDRLIKFKPPEKMGMAKNWNYCVSKAKGEYIVLLSSDDKLSPDFLKEQSAILDNFKNASFAFCAVYKIDENSRVIGIHKSPLPSRLIPSKDAYLWYLDGPKNTLVSALFRKSLWDKAGRFSEKYKICIDWAFWMDLIKMGDVYYNQKLLAFYRTVEGKNHGYLTQQEEIFDVFNKSVINCPKNLAVRIERVSNRIRRRLVNRTIFSAIEIRGKNVNEFDKLLALAADEDGRFITKIKIFFTRSFICCWLLIMFKKFKELIKIIIKKIIWYFH